MTLETRRIWLSPQHIEWSWLCSWHSPMCGWPGSWMVDDPSRVMIARWFSEHHAAMHIWPFYHTLHLNIPEPNLVKKDHWPSQKCILEDVLAGSTTVSKFLSVYVPWACCTVGQNHFHRKFKKIQWPFSCKKHKKSWNNCLTIPPILALTSMPRFAQKNKRHPFVFDNSQHRWILLATGIISIFAVSFLRPKNFVWNNDT